VEVRDVFPPDAPLGLVAVPELASTGAGPGVTSIDLSWDPNPEPRIAGYRVYRRDVESGASDSNAAPDAWHSLSPDLVRVPSYRDSTVAAGKRYAYRVTAVSESGNESAPSAPATETAPAPETAP
jgi:fibronectin type 3 domain-containing protein